MKYVFVEADQAERTKRALADQGLLVERAPVLKEDARIGFAVSDAPEGFAVEERDVQVERAPQSLRRALRDRFGERGDEIKRAFDVIGDIAIIESSAGFEDIEVGIAECLLEVHRNVKAVYVKDGGHAGDFRIQSYRWLAGERRTRTVHRENGYDLELDIAETYFSPRVGPERLRIARLVRDGERVLVLGSGIGPYPMCIEKHADPEHVVAVEFNDAAHRWAQRNVELNRCERIETIEADAAAYLQEAREQGDAFDRIVMPLPAQSAELLPGAWRVLSSDGVLHCYMFLDEEELIAPPIEGIEDFTVERIQTVGAAAPGRWRVCVDLRKNDRA